MIAYSNVISPYVWKNEKFTFANEINYFITVTFMKFLQKIIKQAFSKMPI